MSTCSVFLLCMCLPSDKAVFILQIFGVENVPFSLAILSNIVSFVSASHLMSYSLVILYFVFLLVLFLSVFSVTDSSFLMWSCLLIQYNLM